jgi:hypothetical protein
LRFELEAPGAARLRIFDVSGRMVRELVHAWFGPGSHERVWDGRDAGGHGVASGPYFVQLQTGERSLSRRVMLVR